MDTAPVPSLAIASTACFACFSPSSPSSPLSRCSACRRVKYCSPACAASDWKDHKPFCKALTAIRKTLKPIPPPAGKGDKEALRSSRDAHWDRWATEDDLLQAALKRQPTPTEGQLLWREQRCGVCWAREGVLGEVRGGWKGCEGCGMTGWCEGCEGEGSGRHERGGECEEKSECQTLQLLAQIDSFLLSTHLSAAAADATASAASQAPLDPSALPTPPSKPPRSVFLPPRVLSSPTPLPSSWSAFVEALLQPAFPPGTTKAQIYAQHLPSLSPALTILATLRRLYPSSSALPIDKATSLTLLLLDETPTTSKTFSLALEELFHQLPALTHIRTVTVAPQETSAAAQETPSVDGGKEAEKAKEKKGKKEVEVVAMPLCKACKTARRSRTIEHVQTLVGFYLSPSSASASASTTLPSRFTSLDLDDDSSAAPSASEPISLVLACAFNSSLPLCTPPAYSLSHTPADLFWRDAVLVPLSSLSFTPGEFVPVLVTAQTRDDVEAALEIVRSGGGEGKQGEEKERENEGSWKAERNVWRETKPRVEGWWDHRAARADGEEEEEGGISWLSGWIGVVKL